MHILRVIKYRINVNNRLTFNKEYCLRNSWGNKYFNFSLRMSDSRMPCQNMLIIRIQLHLSGTISYITYSQVFKRISNLSRFKIVWVHEGLCCRDIIIYFAKKFINSCHMKILALLEKKQKIKRMVYYKKHLRVNYRSKIYTNDYEW